MQLPNEAARPLQFVKVLSWSFFALIFSFSMGLSLFLANYAENTLLEKQKVFGLLLAENLNHQIYTRFTLPTLLGFGQISLGNDNQYARLDQVVRSTIHSFHVRALRIYDFDYEVSYSLNKDEVRKKDLAGEAVRKALSEEKPNFVVLRNISTFGALFSPRLKPGSVLLLGFFPLRAERSLTDNADNPIMGVMEYSQDITDDYVTVVNFQRLILATSLLTSTVLFFVIVFVLRRADRLNAQRLREKEKLERELAQQEKLAGMGRMVAGVAHEIRNPLGIIRSSAELILKKARAEQSPYTRLIEALFEESKRLSRTVSDFLDYARPKKPRMDDVDLGQVLEQAAVFLENEFQQRGVEMECDFAPGLLVLGDKDLIYRALYNVISNALQALPGEGRVSIAAARENGHIRISVRDTGPGFDPQHMERYRDPFFTTKDTGTGLGLAIVGSILESHHAALELSNNAEGGARVDMVFEAK